MTEKWIVFDNKRDRKIYELYLNPKGADVNFVFDGDTDHAVKVQAHKIILSLDSPVFDTMFFGAIPERGDIEIVDVSVEAFKEFLQFFYSDEVHLSFASIVEVTNLCKKYETKDFLKLREKALQSSLTIDEMCWGYGIAELLEQENLKTFCEEQITMNAATIIRSKSFLECDKRLLTQILNLVSSDWGALDRVIACMEWSKAGCTRNNLDLSSKNLRNQLNCVFNQIPFDKLTQEQFSQHVSLYKGFFTAEELETFINSSSSQRSQRPNPFDLQLFQCDLPNIPANELLECNRWRMRTKRNSKELCTHSDSTTVFSSNVTLLLVEFHLLDIGLYFQYWVCQSGADNGTFDELILEGKSGKPVIVLPKAVVISPGKKYVIRVACLHPTGSEYLNYDLEDNFELKYGIKIRFYPTHEDNMIKMVLETPVRVR
ncbi:BTB/POZ domain-containing protein 2-like [Bradysia coprophila]|uniref:BTB/POZ domain-containing protein 2-like n=1 Tax=Bradysia coprophila TaxID=38358 RepID=UPI00187D9F66|nr:BTB/POZ domain-containing protein 2-like [Bradysia coprophila]